MDKWYLENWKLKANLKALPTKQYLQDVMQSCLDIMSYYDAIWYDDEFIEELNKSNELNRIEEKNAVIEEILS